MGAGLHVRRCIARLLFFGGEGVRRKGASRRIVLEMFWIHAVYVYITYTYHVSFLIYHMSYIYKSISP